MNEPLATRFSMRSDLEDLHANSTIARHFHTRRCHKTAFLPGACSKTYFRRNRAKLQQLPAQKKPRVRRAYRRTRQSSARANTARVAQASGWSHQLTLKRKATSMQGAIVHDSQFMAAPVQVNQKGSLSGSFGSMLQSKDFQLQTAGHEQPLARGANALVQVHAVRQPDAAA